MSGKKFKSLFLIIPLSFLLGLAWGTHIIEKKRELNASKQKNKIQILAYDDFFPPNLISEFENTKGIDVVLTVPSSEQDFFDLSINKTQDFDLIFLRQENAKLLMDSGKLDKLDWSKIKSIDKLSPDFKNLTKEYEERLLPMFWNILGYVLLKEKEELFEADFRDIFVNKKYRKHLSLYPNIIDLYSTLKSLNLIAENWFELDQNQKIQKTISLLSEQKVLFQDQVDIKTLNSKELWAVQAPHTEALKVTNGNDLVTFWLPPQKASLNIDLAGLVKGANQKSVYSFLNHMTQPKHTYTIVNHAHRATVFNIPINDQVLGYQTPQFLRKIPLGRIYNVKKHYGHHKDWVSLTKDLFPTNQGS